MSVPTLALAAGLFGSMALAILTLAIGLAVYVWRRPGEAPAAGMLFLFAADILLPFGARFYLMSDDISQMYYWATGLLLITAAAVLRIGVVRAFALPRSAQVFLAVAIAAAVYGLTRGATISYALRQFYGALLLIAYLGIAYHAGNEELLTQRIAAYGVPCAFAFFIYYIAVFQEYGFHKEMGYVGAQASFLAILLLFAGIGRKKYLWVSGAIALMGVPVLIFARKDVLTFLLAIPVAFAMKLRSKALRFLSYCAITLIALPALFPAVTQLVAERMVELPVVGEILPEGARTSVSLYDRTVQLVTAMESVRANPLLGDGLGTGFQFEGLTSGLQETVYVDNGWAHLFQKMGLLGAAAFLWLLITTFTGASRKSVGLSACLISAALVTTFSQPVFLHFTTAPFLGSFAGLLLAEKDRARKAAALSLRKAT
jgi:O-antigen ligase